MTTQQLAAAVPVHAGVGQACAPTPRIGAISTVDANGTHLTSTFRTAVWDKISDWSGGLQGLLLMGWRLDRGSATSPGSMRQTGIARCSATLDELERPTAMHYFTPSMSEWVSDFVLDSPPVFVSWQTKTVATPRTENVGVETVTWLRDFLATSQERACAYAHVPLATFYMWRKKPNSVVRPASVSDGLRLRATLELAASLLGRDEVVRLISSGHPSVLDRLGSATTWNDAVGAIAALSTPDLTRPAQPMNEADSYLERLNDLDAAHEPSPGSVILGAVQMSPEQIADAEGWGWGPSEEMK